MATEFQVAVRREFGGHDIAGIVLRAEQGFVKGGGLRGLVRLAHGNDLQGMCYWGRRSDRVLSVRMVKNLGPDAGGRDASRYLLSAISASYIDNACEAEVDFGNTVTTGALRVTFIS